MKWSVRRRKSTGRVELVAEKFVGRGNDVFSALSIWVLQQLLPVDLI
jgi:hypothetical protein